MTIDPVLAELRELTLRVNVLGSRMDRMERRVLRWGAVVLLGAEAARMFLAPLAAQLMEVT